MDKKIPIIIISLLTTAIIVSIVIAVAIYFYMDTEDTTKKTTDTKDTDTAKKTTDTTNKTATPEPANKTTECSYTSDWGEWSVCKDGKQSVNRSYTGTGCADFKRTRDCTEPEPVPEPLPEPVVPGPVPEPVNTCEYGEWGEWGDCKDGKQTKSRTYTGTGCDLSELDQTQDCLTPEEQKALDEKNASDALLKSKTDVFKIFKQGHGLIGENIGSKRDGTPEELKVICHDTVGCEGFNTTGWLKKNIYGYTTSKFSSNKDEGAWTKEVKNIDPYIQKDNHDLLGEDITKLTGKTITQLKQACDQDDLCTGFNSEGYLKKYIKSYGPVGQYAGKSSYTTKKDLKIPDFYLLKNPDSNKCIDENGNMQTCNVYRYQQQWDAQSRGGGNFSYVNRANGKCLDSKGIVSECNGSYWTQQWAIKDGQLIDRDSGICLVEKDNKVWRGGSAIGDSCKQMTPKTIWENTKDPANTIYKTTTAVRIKHDDSGKCIDGEGSLVDCNPASLRQQWDIQGTLLYKNRENGKCLNTDGKTIACNDTHYSQTLKFGTNKQFRDRNNDCLIGDSGTLRKSRGDCSNMPTNSKFTQIYI